MYGHDETMFIIAASIPKGNASFNDTFFTLAYIKVLSRELSLYWFYPMEKT
jgi:hypothetical protein